MGTSAPRVTTASGDRARDDARGCSPQLRAAPQVEEVPKPVAGPGRDRGEDRGVGPLPHRHPRRARRLAGQAEAAVHPGPRGRRHRGASRRGRHGGRGRRPRRHALAGYACGTCDYCVSGWETLVRAAEHGLLDRRRLRRVRQGVCTLRRQVPDGIDPVRRGPADVRRRDHLQGGQGRRARPGRPRRDLGHRRPGSSGAAVRANQRGGVVAVDLFDDKLELARELGAEFTVNAAEQDPVAAIKQLGGADAADRARRRSEGVRAGLRVSATRRNPVLVALPAENKMELPIFETVLNGITVVGSIVGTRLDLREVFELHAAGKTRVIREERPLDDVHIAMEDVLRGDVPARIVLPSMKEGAEMKPFCLRPTDRRPRRKRPRRPSSSPTCSAPSS